jgi:hypothetical protein
MTVHRDFSFEIRRSHRRKTLCLQIRDGQVQVLVPARTSGRQIEDLIHKHSGWIEKKLREQSARPKAPARAFADGEVFACLGRDHTLKVVQGPPWPAEPRGGELLVTVPDQGDEAAIRARIIEWYHGAALATFQDRTAHFARRLGVSATSVKVRAYKRRWGSCSAKGDLSFNWRLALAPVAVADYVAAHELSHLVHHNHSPRFWAVVEGLLPDYRDQQQWLNKFGGLLDI